ncbi:MAG: 16S rRNA (uracil(1498)-N(3))-methyltransferase [Actinomycetota bacterium]
MLLAPDEAHHAKRVLRLGAGAVVFVTDGDGRVARGTIVGDDAGRVAAPTAARRRHERPLPEITVFQGAAKGAKLDHVTERLAQLGVADLRVFHSRRAVVRWDRRKRELLDERWRAVARSAAKQSRSPFVMSTARPMTWEELVSSVAEHERVLVAWEKATKRLREALADAARVALVVGPEGGLEDAETRALEAVGASIVSLGGPILRTEDAAVVAASAILYRYGIIG